MTPKEKSQLVDYEVKLPPAEMLRLMMKDRAAATAKSIEEEGQRELLAANGASLPITGSEHPCFAKMGIVFGAALDGFFREATLPPGWSLEASGEHVMWTDLVDDRGRKRARLHHKALLTARMASMKPTVRYIARIEYQGEFGRPGESNRGFVFDNSTQTEIFTTRTLRREGNDRMFLKTDTLKQEVAQWLKEHFPDHEDPAAYWDCPTAARSRPAPRRSSSKVTGALINALRGHQGGGRQ